MSDVLEKPSDTPPPKPTPLRLAYLDGLRGAAAFFVVIHHIYIDMNRHDAVPHAVEHFTRWLQLGHYAVGVFIVLSGYSLMLPVARSADAQLPGGMSGYIYRRARRILPPYYAALILTLLCGMAFPALLLPSDTHWSEAALPLFSPGAVISHFLLVHNLHNAWSMKINPPFWSVATEWQIYFFFPLFLLPVWRRFGTIASVTAAFALGLGLTFILKDEIAGASPWYLGLFACGMAAAAVNFPSVRSPQGAAARAPWGVLTCVFGAGLALIIKRWPGTIWLSDLFDGLAAASLLVYCTRAVIASASGERPWIVKALETRPMLFLGEFSYSLYLVHFQINAMVHVILNHRGYSDRAELVLLPLLSLPMCLLGAYAFHRVFELPFMSSRKNVRVVR